MLSASKQALGTAGLDLAYRARKGRTANGRLPRSKCAAGVRLIALLLSSARYP